MQLVFKQKFKSIQEFNPSKVENFSVFLGTNGAGKTHLLRALEAKSVDIQGIKSEKISYFNFQTFLIKNQKDVSLRNLDDEKLEAWNILNSKRNLLEKVDSSIKVEIGDIPSPYEQDAKTKSQTYRDNLANLFDFVKSRTQGKPKITNLIMSALLDSGKYVSELSQKEFFKYANYNPDDYELLTSLSEMFLDYQKKIVLSRLPTEDGGEALSTLEVDNLRNNAPWHFINRMFKEFGLSHHLTEPPFVAADFINSQSLSYQVKIFINDEEINFEDLSSGEKILCALAITVYQDNQSTFPELLLLDEIDASLHPSMIQNLLDVIHNIFIKNNCSVILATHSPTTVALAPEESLFEIKKGLTAEKIVKINQAEAIELLSEGIMTFERGIKIQSEFVSTKPLQIITEGNNSEHIRHVLSVLDKELLQKLKIIDGTGCGGGAQQLKNAFDALSKADHTGKFLFVWDCDFHNKVGSIVETDSFKKFCFAVNPNNTKAVNAKGEPSGIENLYPDELFTEDVYSSRQEKASMGATNNIQIFDKAKFLEKVKLNNEPDVFERYISLIQVIKGLTQ